jgi:hypothetical protein
MYCRHFLTLYFSLQKNGFFVGSHLFCYGNLFSSRKIRRMKECKLKICCTAATIFSVWKLSKRITYYHDNMVILSWKHDNFIRITWKYYHVKIMLSWHDNDITIKDNIITNEFCQHDTVIMTTWHCFWKWDNYDNTMMFAW